MEVPIPARLAGRLVGSHILAPRDDAQSAATALAELDVQLAAEARPAPMRRIVSEDVRMRFGTDELFDGQVASDVMAVVSCVVAYVANRVGDPKPFMRAGTSTDDPEEDADKVVEQDLADDLQEWIGCHLDYGSVAIEAQRVAAGRVDIGVGFGAYGLVLELKKEEKDASREALHAHYGDQAASYQATDYPFGIVVVLDRTARTVGTPHLRDLVWAEQIDLGGVPRWLMWAVVPGNVVPPSSFSRRRTRG